MASFFSSLVGSYSDSLIKKHRAEREKDERAKQAELSVIQTAIQTGQLDQSGMQAAFARADEITKELAGGKKNKSGFSLGNLIGKFGDVGGQTQAGAANQGGATPQRTGTGSTAAPAAQPIPSGGADAGKPSGSPIPPGQGAGQPTAGVNLGQPPQRGAAGLTFRKPEDIAYEKELARVKAENAGKTQAERDEETFVIAEAKEAHPEWTPKDIFNNVIGPRHGIQPAEPPKPTAIQEKRLQTIHDLLITHPDWNYEKAQKEAARLELEREPGEKPVKPKVSNEAGYPYIQTGDPKVDLPRAEEAYRKGIKTREDEASKAGERTARRTALNQATTTFRQNVTTANQQLAKAKATLESKEKEIRTNTKTITAQLLAKNPEMVTAKAEVAKAQQQVQNAKDAQTYINSMSLAVQEGTIDQNAVLDAANEIAATGRMKAR